MRRLVLLLVAAGCQAPSAVVDGATLRDLAFFQAVEVPVLADGVAVESSDRSAPLIAGRSAIVRALIDVPDDWQASELRLLVDRIEDDTTTTYEASRTLAAASSEDPTSGIVVEIPAEAMTPLATYVVSLVGDDGLHARFPASGEASLDAVETGPLAIRFVPFEVNGFTPDTSQAVIDGLRDALMAAFPVTAVETSVAEVQTWDEPFDLGDINVQVGVIQEQDMIAGRVPWTTYYYGLASGVASREAYEGITGTSENGGSEPLVRAYFAAGAAFGDARSEETLLHEMGHVQGLLHTDCDGEDNPDPAYPHADGAIGVEGYDRRTGTFLPADTKDLMTYCAPRWISDYGFAKIADHVAGAQAYAGYE